MEDINLLFFNHASTKESDESVDLAPVIVSVAAAARISGSSVLIIDFDEHKLLYRTEHLIHIDEAVKEDYKRVCANPYWSLVSEDTLQKLLRIRNNYKLFGDGVTLDEYEKHVCIIDFPIYLRNHELFVTQKFTPLFLRGDGITRIGMFIIKSSNKLSLESTIVLPSGKRFCFDFENNQFQPFDLPAMLSPSEMAVINRVKKGMTNEEIAESLFVSVNTIKTHRSRIFRKLGVETIAEAIAEIDNYILWR